MSGAASPCSPAPFWLKPEARSRAQRSAQSVAVLAVSCTTPVQSGAQPDHLAQPVHDDLFDLGRGRARLPAHPLRAEPGGHEIGEDRRVARVRREVGEERRVVPVRDPGQDQLIEPRQRRRQLAPRARRLRREARPDLPRPHRAPHRQALDPLPVRRHPLHHLVSQPAKRRCIHGDAPRTRSSDRSMFGLWRKLEVRGYRRERTGKGIPPRLKWAYSPPWANVRSSALGTSIAAKNRVGKR